MAEMQKNNNKIHGPTRKEMIVNKVLFYLINISK